LPDHNKYQFKKKKKKKRIAQDVKRVDCRPHPVSYDGSVWDLGQGLVEVDSQVPHSDSRVYGKVGVGVGGIAEGKGRYRITETAAPTMIPEGHEFCLGGVNAKATVHHPINHSMKMQGDKVGGVLVVPCDRDECAIIDIQLGPTLHPLLGQAEERGCVQGRQDG
jgi:hypothetical protein